MKLVPQYLADHLKQEVTTLASVMLIRRQDGGVFYFTDHDMPVIVGGARYVPWYSFTRSSMISSTDLEVTGMEINGILNSDALARADVSNGLFDFSTVEVRVVNYENPEHGTMLLRKGTLGEVTVQEDGSFWAELRGLTQVYTYRLGDAYSPECRADLGDYQCKIPLNPKLWQPKQYYRNGQSVVANVHAGYGYTEMVLNNQHFESDSDGVRVTAPTGWNAYGDIKSCWISENLINRSGDGEDVRPKLGNRFITQAQVSLFTPPAQLSPGGGIWQDVDLIAQGALEADLDTGLSRVTFSTWCTITDQLELKLLEQTRVRLHAVNAAGEVFATVFDTGFKSYTPGMWFEEKCDNRNLPAGTRKLRVDLSVTRDTTTFSTYCGAFDSPKLIYVTPSGAYGGSEVFGAVAFTAQNSGQASDTQPAFTDTVGATYTDGDIVWKAVTLLKKPTEIEEVLTSKRFACMYRNEVDGYFDGGLLIWETGRNAGRAQEIKSWDSGIVEVFQRPYYLPEPGDRLALHPGCAKTRQECIVKFNNIVNFRGEPVVPGQDEFYKTPNAPGDNDAGMVDALVAQVAAGGA